MAQILASTVRTATTTADLGRDGRNGVMLIVDVTAVTTSTVTPHVQLYDDTLGSYFNFITVTTAITGTGQYVYVIREDEPTAVSPITEIFDRKIPSSEFLRLNMVHGDSSNWTYSVTALWYPT